jgi:phospholipid/cholesterol/gamma-HCH transport system permease protein
MAPNIRTQEISSPANFKVSRPEPDTLLVHLGGSWRKGERLPSFEAARKEIGGQPPLARLAFDSSGLASWDSGLLVFLANLFGACRQAGTSVDPSGLPEGVQKLLGLASPENQRSGVSREEERASFLEKVADRALGGVQGIRATLTFIGEATLAFLNMLRGRANFRRLDLLTTLQETGAQAFSIVSLISLLVGMILAFVGAIQLKLFGAQIFVADVVGIGVVRVMGAIMTGIIMAGRTGAAFAAQLGTMQVNEEIDALETLGLSPVEFLVLPRMLALMLMMPLLCLYSDLMGVLGGMIVGVGMLDLGVVEYVHETTKALTLTHLSVGLFHSFVFGVLVALFGCLRGIQCERSASAVGYAATSAVVTGIVSIVIATAIITLSCQVLGI